MINEIRTSASQQTWPFMCYAELLVLASKQNLKMVMVPLWHHLAEHLGEKKGKTCPRSWCVGKSAGFGSCNVTTKPIGRVATTSSHHTSHIIGKKKPGAPQYCQEYFLKSGEIKPMSVAYQSRQH